MPDTKTLLVDQFDSDDSQAIQERIGRAMPDVFPALSMLVRHRGEPIFSGCWGWVDPDRQTRLVGVSTRFDLASLTKLFTMNATLSSISSGEISLDDRVASIIPEFGAAAPRAMDGGQDPHTRKMAATPARFADATVDPHSVTIKHLLTHTSGLAPWRAIYDAAGPPPPPGGAPDNRSDRVRRGLAAICRSRYVDIPGERVHYSDLGYILLGEITARLDGGALDGALDCRVFAPSGLSQVGYNPMDAGVDRMDIAPTEYDSQWRKRRVWGEVHDENACGLGGVAGHAGLFGTARDAAQFGELWLERDPRLGIDPPLMVSATREQASGQHRLGLGWRLKSPDSSAGAEFGPRSFGHTGFTGTSLWVDPDRQLVCAILTNRVYVGRHKEGIHAFRRDMHDLIARGVDRL